jgi:hypothetical protein
MTALDWLFWGSVLLILVGAAANEWRLAREREALDAAPVVRPCETCGRIAPVRVVPLYRGSTVACDGCAALLTGRAA